MSSLPVSVSIILMVTMACSFIWAFSEVFRRMSVRGSRPRYVWATAEHATRYPALVYLVLSTTLELRFGTTLQTFLDMAAIGLWAYVMWEKWNGGEDDDWFNDQKKKLLKKLRSFGRTPAVGMAT